MLFRAERVSAILRAMPRQTSVAIVGAGNFGSALARLLSRNGYEVWEVVTRAGKKPSGRAAAEARKAGGSAVALGDAALDADVLWLCVPDDVIGECAKEVARRGTTAKVALHSSGALASEVLSPLRKNGVAVGSAHPLMSFVTGPPPSLKDVLFAVEGDSRAVVAASRIARKLGGVPFRIDKKNKALYHAFGAFTSPLLIAHFATAETLAQAAGVPKASIRRAMQPIVLRTIENYFTNGGAAAFSGPLVRGDIQTVRKHLKALARFPEALALYKALVREALSSLPVANRKALKRLLHVK
jgi:predicted short-subunit dehydrogenase-like oxidoreductase (DUF2520 family)